MCSCSRHLNCEGFVFQLNATRVKDLRELHQVHSKYQSSMVYTHTHLQSKEENSVKIIQICTSWRNRWRKLILHPLFLTLLMYQNYLQLFLCGHNLNRCWWEQSTFVNLQTSKHTDRTVIIAGGQTWRLIQTCFSKTGWFQWQLQ